MKNKIQLFIMLALVLAFTGANAQYTGGNGRGDIVADKAATKLGNNFVTNGNWSVSNNWSISALPASDEVVYILANATLDQDVTINGLVIHTGSSLTIPSGKTLTVNGALTNNASNGGLVIESGGSLIHNSNDIAATVKLTITGSSNLTLNKYHFVSIPTQYAAPTSNLFLGSYLYDLDPTQLNENNDFGKWIGLGELTNTPLFTNKGYMIYYPGASKEYSFTGSLNNGTFNYALSGHSNKGIDIYTFNLIPNPYPSAIVWNTADASWSASPGIGGVCYIWNNGNYTKISPALTN
jgi:hypothetical protein